ncbi:MAG: endopeptidase La [Lachnospiraceae bacterium]|nr:endopeptidase La [Lachnospiraceae bacterium]
MLVMPVYDVLLLPDVTLYFQTQLFKKQTGGRDIVPDERVILVVQKEEKSREELDEDSFYPIGVTGYISEINDQGYVGIRTTNRVNLDMVGIGYDHSISLTISRRGDVNDLDEREAEEKLSGIKDMMRDMLRSFEWNGPVEGIMEHISTIGQAAVMVSPWLKQTNEERYAILAEDSVAKRTRMLEEVLYEQMEVARVTNEANTSQQKEYQDMYREAAIKKQMEYLQKELDEMHPENVSDVRRFEEKIASSGMNETARKEAEKVLRRLKQEGKESAESGILYDYLDFVTGLSWTAEEPEHIDLKEAEKILDEDHYGLKKVKRRIIEQIAVMNLRKSQAGSILLFVGAPGTGKTSIGRSIARALHREYVRVSLGGVHDESDIRGHRRTYIGAMPGRIMDGIHKSGVSNPVMVLDEVDKLSASYNGDPASALLEVLDPEQNNTFTDHYMNVPYDLSDVMFICTANTTDSIPEPLLNRMEVIEFTGYSPTDKMSIAKEHLIPKAMEDMGITPGQLVVEDETISRIIEDYTAEGGVRGLRKRIDTLCRSAAVMISRRDGAAEPGKLAAEDAPAESGNLTAGDEASAQSGSLAAGEEPTAVAVSETEPVVVRPEDLRDMLDMHPLHHEKILEKPAPGIVTGLAWTQIGGKILYIETLFTKGSGKLTITGQLGDVMKESAQIAVSLVKAMFPDKAELFEKNDLHIHVPEGAVPKDGPSAGITLTTALSSLVTGRPVDPQIAMTGEVSLRGVVTPIGGLPEKLMAAHRAGITKVFIPKDNEEDLREVSEEVKDALEITPVSRVEDVLKAAGILQ